MTLALAPIRDKFERALRNGELLHLEIDQVRIIARTPIWPMLADLTAKELASLWESEQPNPAPPPPATTPPASSLDPIGSNTGLSGTTGASDRKSVVSGKGVSVRVDLGGRRIIKKKNQKSTN